MKRIVGALIAVSVIIYGIQLMVFRDPNTTIFYILQDVAFLPISIAVATIVVGEYLGSREKKERREKTQMLTSSFFTELGSELLQNLLPLCNEREEVKTVFRQMEIKDDQTLDELRKRIKEIRLSVQLNEEAFEQVKQMICVRREILLVISSNPLLLDHADFTKLLWGLFHLTDEFRLRGDFAELSKSDIAHLEQDFSDILKLLLLNWARNVLYTRKQYPNYYNSSIGKLLNQK